MTIDIIRGVMRRLCFVILVLCVLFNIFAGAPAYADADIPTTPDPSTVETSPDGSVIAPAEPVAATEAPTAAPTTEAPTDYSELNRQITIADGLDENQYDAAAWKQMQTALTKAREAIEREKKQAEADKVCEELKDAISGLRLIDYTALKAAIAEAQVYQNEDVPADFAELFTALSEAQALTESRDQASIDAAGTKLAELTEALRAKMEEIVNPTVVVEKEVEKIVEVEPTSDYCNITMHKVWPVLFFVSLAFNIGFAAIMILRIMNTRARISRGQKDGDGELHTPDGLKYQVLSTAVKEPDPEQEQEES